MRPSLAHRRIAASLVGAILALGAAELLLGGPLRPELQAERDAGWQQALHRMHAEIYRADPELVYVPRPGASVDMDYGPAAFNFQGLRKAGPVGPKGEAKRVILLGDSLVWGELLAPEEALPAALEQELGPGFEALNLGVSGYDTVQELGWYQRAGRPLAPDVVVLVYCLNDMLIQSGPYGIHADAQGLRAQEEEQAWLEARAPLRNETVNRLWWAARGGDGSQVVAALQHAWRWHRLFSLPGGYVDDYLLAAREPSRVERSTRALAALGQAIHSDGARPILVLSPALYWWHHYQWGEIHALIRGAGEAAGFEILDPLARWAGEEPAPFRFPGDNLHYTAWGTRRLARLIAEALEGSSPSVGGSSPPGP